MDTEEKLDQIDTKIDKIDCSLTNVNLTLASLTPVIEEVGKHGKTLYGDDHNHGMRIDVDRLKETEKQRSWQIRAIWGAGLSAVTGGVAWLLSRS